MYSAGSRKIGGQWRSSVVSVAIAALAVLLLSSVVLALPAPQAVTFSPFYLAQLADYDFGDDPTAMKVASQIIKRFG